MMTKKEFISLYRPWQRRRERQCFWVVISILAFLIGSNLLLGYCETRKSLEWVFTAYSLAVCAAFIGGILFFLRRRKRYSKWSGYCCPSCGALLYTKLAEVAIACGGCGRCGAKVFEEEQEPHETGHWDENSGISK